MYYNYKQPMIIAITRMVFDDVSSFQEQITLSPLRRSSNKCKMCGKWYLEISRAIFYKCSKNGVISVKFLFRTQIEAGEGKHREVRSNKYLSEECTGIPPLQILIFPNGAFESFVFAIADVSSPM